MSHSVSGIHASSHFSRALRWPITGFLWATAVFVPPSFAQQVALNWADNASNESGNQIERATGTGSFAQIAATGANVVSYVDGAVTASTAYRYRVRAYNGAGSSAYSNTISITTGVASPTNTAPVIATITNRTINEDGNTGAIAVTVSDGETSAGSLQFSATSSNTALIPNGNVSLGGGAGNRTITVTPAANQSGTTTITASVSDGSLAASATFTVAVTAVNDAPTITNISDRGSILGTAPATINFTVGDVDTSTTSLTITASSSNAALLPNTGLVLGGSGANRTLLLQPLAGLLGSTTVTVSATDGSLSASDTFVLSVSVATANTAPTISAIVDRTIPMDGTTAIAFVIGDAQTPVANLTVSSASSDLVLIPLANITLAGSGANRTVTVRPVALRTGSSTISINVGDGALVRSEVFVVNVDGTTNLTWVDIGLPAIPGSHVITGDSIQIRAGGAARALTADQFHFGYASTLDDAELTVRVASLTRANAQTRAGLMFRASAAASSAQVSVFLVSDYGVVLVYRSASGASYQYKTPMAAIAPQWLRLTRTGDTFYAFTSEDGATWDLVEFVTVDLPPTVLAGLAATSHNATVATTAVFDGLIVD